MTIGQIGIYLLEVSVLLILLYIFNKLLLGRETLHRLNRALWLSILALSFVMPLCVGSAGGYVDMPILDEAQQLFDYEALAVFGGGAEQLSTTQIIVNLLFWIYVVGAGIMLCYMVATYFSLLRLVLDRRYDVARWDDALAAKFGEYERAVGVSGAVRYVVHNRDLAPFSWMNFVVVSRADLQQNGREIIIHELSHIKQHHSLDVVALNLATIILWFNPAVWLTKSALQQVHEYCADEAVLRAGVNGKEYQLLLIKKAVGTRLYSISNSLNHSNLKNRITMMLKKKSSPLAWAKCLYAIPVAITAIAAFASPAFAAKTNAITSAKVTNYFADNKTETPPTNEMQSERILYFMDGMIIKNGNEISPDRIKSVSVTKKSSTEEWQNHKAWESCNPDDYDAIIELTLNQAVVSVEQPITVKEIDNALYVINDEVVEKSIFDNLDTNKIQAISVLKGENNVKKYDNSGKYSGAIVITLKDGETIQSAINTKGTDKQKIRVIDTRMESILE